MTRRACSGTLPSRPNHSLRANTADSVHVQGARVHLAAPHDRVADTRHLLRGQNMRKKPGGLDCMRILPCNTLQHTNDNQCCTRPMREMNERVGAGRSTCLGVGGMAQLDATLCESVHACDAISTREESTSKE